MKKFLILISISIVGFIVSVILHNVISATFSFEEPVFFILGVIVFPILFLSSIIVLVIKIIKGDKL
ncbi:MAG: hypothetical protein PHI53_03755 [Candidatus Pacebacteria bacterium]|nr:hypothetical protein [Candidatus Paceibacterota bacterium]